MGNSPSGTRNVKIEETQRPPPSTPLLTKLPSSSEHAFDDDSRRREPASEASATAGQIDTRGSQVGQLPATGAATRTTSQSSISNALDESLLTIQQSLQKLSRDGRNLIAGGVAGIVAKSVVAPLDRIKILYQVSSAQFRLFDIPKVVANIVRDEGWSALWKGNMATMIRVFPYSGIQFMVFDYCKNYVIQAKSSPPPQQSPASAAALSKSPHTPKSSWLMQAHRHRHHTTSPIHTVTNAPEVADRHDRKWGLTPLESLVAGMIAGTVSVVCTYPLDLARAQLAVLKKTAASQHQGFVSVLYDNYGRGGVAGLFRGITPTLLGILPYSGIAFALNEQGKQEIQHLTGREVTTMERMQCGAFSGLVAQTVTYPIEVTRRRMQTIGVVGTRSDTALASLGCSNATTPHANVKTPPTVWATVQYLYAEQGWRGFLKGVSMNWMKGPVAFSISFTTFDYAKQLMEPPKPQ